MTGTAIPMELQQLLALVPEWAPPSARDRQTKRVSSSIENLRTFHDQVAPHVAGIGEYLDQFDRSTLAGDHRSLLLLGLMFMEAALAVEVYHEPGLTDAFPVEKFISLV